MAAGAKPRPLPAGCLLVALCAAFGCQTIQRPTLPSIQPPAPAFQPSVEHSVGEFTYVMNTNDPKPSTLDGKLLSKEIMRAWKERETFALYSATNMPLDYEDVPPELRF